MVNAADMNTGPSDGFEFKGHLPSFPGKMSSKRYVQLNFLYIQGARIQGYGYADINTTLRIFAKIKEGYPFDISDKIFINYFNEARDAIFDKDNLPIDLRFVDNFLLTNNDPLKTYYFFLGLMFDADIWQSKWGRSGNAVFAAGAMRLSKYSHLLLRASGIFSDDRRISLSGFSKFMNNLGDYMDLMLDNPLKLFREDEIVSLREIKKEFFGYTDQGSCKQQYRYHIAYLMSAIDALISAGQPESAHADHGQPPQYKTCFHENRFLNAAKMLNQVNYLKQIKAKKAKKALKS